MSTHHWIFLSPHLDDAVLSCGGLLWDLFQSGDTVAIWTMMAGLPMYEDYSPFAQEIHLLWGISGEGAIRMRRAEDLAACAVLGAQARHFDWTDAIYRRDPHSGVPVVVDIDTLFSASPEPELVANIAAVLREDVPEGARLVLPMGLGGHIDHRAVVLAGEQVREIEYYYADYPYILENFDHPSFADVKWKSILHPLGQDALDAWCEAVLCHRSQLSTFWRDETETRLALRNYLAGGGGRLWKR
jgi:LmbE family N-acetylglucosaminyl deacetylase